MFNPLNAATPRIIVDNIARTTKQIGLSLQRLSTGQRINGPEDGVADYAIVTRLDAQMRGIRQSIINVNDGTGLVTQAGSALDNMLTTAYQLRELAEKAQDTSLSSTELASLQSNATQLISNLQDYGNNTFYNNINLLNGSFGSQTLQVGPNSGDSYSFSLGDARSITLGSIAISSGVQGAISAGIGSSNQVVLNNVVINGSQSDLKSTSGSTYSAIAIVNAINAQSNSTNVQAEVLSTTRTLGVVTGAFSAVAGFSGTFGTGEFKINSVAISGTISTSANLVSRINSYTAQTGIAASFDSNSNIVLTAADGRNIEVLISNGAGDALYKIFNTSVNNGLFVSPSVALSAGTDSTFVGAVRLWSSSAITVSGTSPSLALGISSGTISTSASTAVQYMNITTNTNANQALKVLDATIAQISSLRANVDAIHSRLDDSASFLVQDYNASDQAKTDIGGADIAMEMAHLVMAQLLQNSGVSALTQANLSYETVARLLKD